MGASGYTLKRGMDNPYLPTNAVIDGVSDSRDEAGILFWLVAVGSSLLSVCMGLFATLVIPAYAELYAGLGAELPAPTVFITGHSLLLWLLLLPPLMVWATWYRAKKEKVNSRFRRQFIAILLLDIAVLASTMWCLYLPIFKVSEAVQ